MPGSEGTTTVTSSDDRTRQSANPAATELSKIVFDEAWRLLEGQREELSNVRTRTVQYLALVATATSFLAGTGLRGAAQTGTFYALAVAGTVLFVLTLLSGLQVLVGAVRLKEDGTPLSGAALWRGWQTPELAFYFSPTKLSDALETPVQVGQHRTQAGVLTSLALQAETYHDQNEVAIVGLKRAYVRCIALGFLQLLFWGGLAWINGRMPVG